MRSPSLEGWVGQERCTSQRREGLRTVAIAGLEPVLFVAREVKWAVAGIP
jgi:hypothetical protein